MRLRTSLHSIQLLNYWDVRAVSCMTSKYGGWFPKGRPPLFWVSKGGLGTGENVTTNNLWERKQGSQAFGILPAFGHITRELWMVFCLPCDLHCVRYLFTVRCLCICSSSHLLWYISRYMLIITIVLHVFTRSADSILANGNYETQASIGQQSLSPKGPSCTVQLRLSRVCVSWIDKIHFP